MTRFRRASLTAIGLAVVLAACSPADSTRDAIDTNTVAQSATTGSTPPTANTTAPADDPTASSLVELRGDLAIDVLVLNSTSDTDAHPTLSWQPADGAASYWLMVRDADGRPFWAWTGSDTTVRVGGGDTPDTNQTAAVHEDMTWRVAAFDADGRLIALSDEGLLSP